jgi:hypothetical protein
MAAEAQICALSMYALSICALVPQVSDPCGYESFMQNKPNFLNSQMNISPVMKKYYEQKTPLRPPPKQTQSNPKILHKMLSLIHIVPYRLAHQKLSATKVRLKVMMIIRLCQLAGYALLQI